MSVEKLNDKQFEEKVLNGDAPAMVDFYADWCEPCKRAGKIFEELSNECDDVRFYKVNVDECTDIAMNYGVMSIPTAILFDKGEQKDQFIGFSDKDALANMLRKL